MTLRNQHGPAHSATDDAALISAVGAMLESLGAAGDEVFLTPDAELAPIWGDPDYWGAAGYLDGDLAEHHEGRPNSCHDNVATVVATTPGVEWWFGYALNDGMWRTHSWGYRPGDGVVVETTVEREAYIGAPLDPKYRALLSDGETPGSGLTKVFVPIEDVEGLGGEWLWAEPVGGGTFRVANIPFFATGLTLDSVVTAPGWVVGDVLSHAYDRHGWAVAPDSESLGGFLRALHALGIPTEAAMDGLGVFAFDSTQEAEVLTLSRAAGIDIEWSAL